MHEHISRTASTCFCRRRWLRQLRGSISQAIMQRLVSAFVLSRLDCCNAVLVGIASSSLAPLQRVVHAAVRTVTGLDPNAHINGKTMELHWPPIYYRIKYKLTMCHHARCSVGRITGLYPRSSHAFVIDPWSEQA